MNRLLKWLKRKFSIASSAECWRKEGEYHATMLARVFSKVAVMLNEAERTLNNEHRADT